MWKHLKLHKESFFFIKGGGGGNHGWTIEIGTMSLMSTYWCSFVGNQVTHHIYYMHFSNHTNLLDVKYYVTNQTNPWRHAPAWFLPVFSQWGCFDGFNHQGKAVMGSLYNEKTQVLLGPCKPNENLECVLFSTKLNSHKISVEWLIVQHSS